MFSLSLCAKIRVAFLLCHVCVNVGGKGKQSHEFLKPTIAIKSCDDTSHKSNLNLPCISCQEVMCINVELAVPGDGVEVHVQV